MWIVVISLLIALSGIYLVNSNIDFSIAFSYFMGGSSSHTMAAPVIVHATAKHTATVIFLHGLGDTGHGWAEAFRAISQPHIKYICPTANEMPVSINGGFKMPSWFDIKGLGEGSEEDEVGIKAASQLLQKFIVNAEAEGISRSRIVVGGFSQGGAVALYSALAEPQSNLAGVLGLSTWLPLHKHFPVALKSNQNTDILQCHGDADPMVNLRIGQLTAAKLAQFNPKHQFKTYPGMGHSSSEMEMQDVKEFLDKTLPSV